MLLFSKEYSKFKCAAPAVLDYQSVEIEKTNYGIKYKKGLYESESAQGI